MRIETYLITPATVTVLGSYWPTETREWAGLDFARAEVRTKSPWSGCDLLHLRVPFCHPDDLSDPPCDEDYDAIYNVYPRAEVGKRWPTRLVKSVAIVRVPAFDPPWAIEVGRAR